MNSKDILFVLGIILSTTPVILILFSKLASRKNNIFWSILAIITPFMVHYMMQILWLTGKSILFPLNPEGPIVFLLSCISPWVVFFDFKKTYEITQVSKDEILRNCENKYVKKSTQRPRLVLTIAFLFLSPLVTIVYFFYNYFFGNF